MHQRPVVLMTFQSNLSKLPPHILPNHYRKSSTNHFAKGNSRQNGNWLMSNLFTKVRAPHQRLRHIDRSVYYHASLKYLKKLLFARIYGHIQSNSLITQKQSGYRPGNNTELQLTYLSNKLYRALDSGDDYTVVYLDISRYFEKIWHEGLTAKCDAEFGIRGKHLDWLKSYLSDRRQSVQVGQAVSTQRSLSAGVPQGSVLGPLLAILYLNGLSAITENEMFIFCRR